MAYLASCRVCLLGNVEIHSIRNTPLQVLYERLTSYKLTTKDKRPETLCFNCLALLQRYHRFHVRSQKSEEILTQLSDNGIEILQETVVILNRDIQRDYGITTIEVYSCPKYEEATVKEEMVSVKEEIENNLQFENLDDSEAALCRVCLVGDVKTCSIRNTPLQIVYEKLINIKLSTAMERDGIVCFMCHWQLRKCRKFINKSKKSESILSELFRNGIQLTQDTVTLLNRQIKPSLETAPVESSSYYSPDVETREISPEQQPKYTNNDNTSYKDENDLECNVCNHIFKSKSQLKDHLRLHDPKRRYECDVCRYRYQSSSHLTAHKKNVHQFNFKCKECNIKFVHKRKFQMHMLTHTEKDSVSCEKCKKIFKNRIALRHHNYQKHPFDKYPCERCDVSFTSERWLRDHVFKMHAIHFPFYICDICGTKVKNRGCIRKHIILVHMNRAEHKCNICKKVLHSKLVLNEHILRHSKLRPFKCTLCPKTFGYRASYLVHMKQHTGVKAHACEICNKSFVYKYSLKEHYTTHSKFTCDICGNQYSKKRFLAEHIMTHITGVIKTYSCVKCDKTFSLNEQLKIHMHKHKSLPKEVPYETCEICNKKCKTLKAHMRLHTGEKPYSCDRCEKSYASTGSLFQHKQTHIVTHEKPHNCTTCGKFFKKKSHLKIHMSTHSEVKPYACKFCSRSYPHQAKLNHHMRSHREKILFSCEQCDRSFSEKRSLESHITICHSSEKECFICEMCFKVYVDKKAFIVHIKTHEKSKPYRCDGEKCKKSFSKISRLARHSKEHFRDKQYACTLCKTMVLRGSLSRHYITKHGGIKPYACNSCDEVFVHFEQVYAHFLRCHNGKYPYTCEFCDGSFTRGTHLRKHIARFHRR